MKSLKQEKTMNQDKQNFSDKNHSKGCGSAMPTMYKPG